MASSAIAETEITDRAHRCLELLSEPEKDVDLGNRLETYRTRFYAWAHSSGALERGIVSLDHRLRYHGRIRLAVLELLDLVENAATTGLIPPTQEGHSKSSVSSRSMSMEAKPPESSEANSQSHIVEDFLMNRDYIGEAIDELNSLEKLIRRASPSSRFTLPFDRPWLDQRIDSDFEDSARRFLRHVFGATVIKPSLVNQLADSFTRRQRGLLYQWQCGRSQKESQLSSYYTGKEEAQGFSSKHQGKDIALRMSDESQYEQLHTRDDSPIRTTAISFDHCLPTTAWKPGWEALDFAATELEVNRLYPKLPLTRRGNGKCLCSICYKVLDLSGMNEEARLSSWR